MNFHRKRKTALEIFLFLLCGAMPLPGSDIATDFVMAEGHHFVLNGKPFRFGGANSYDLAFIDPNLANTTLSDARALGFHVVRTYASIVIGDPKRESVDSAWVAPGSFKKGETNGVYFQSWDSAGEKMLINSGPNGLPRLDAAIAAAARQHIRLVLTLVDSWNFTGGAVQYCAWRHLPIVVLPKGKQAWCPSFYTDAAVRADFKLWIATLLNRRNSVSGVRYKDDPTIMTVELANEPMADTNTLALWAADVASFIHSIDHQHLVSIGNAGFFQTSSEFGRLLKIAGIDYGTLHMYPAYKQPAATPEACIPILKKYLALGPVCNKPLVLEEFGWSFVHKDQARVYTQWTNAVLESGGGGWQFWQFRGHNRDGSLPPVDPIDGFDVFKDNGATSRALSAAALKLDDGAEH